MLPLEIKWVVPDGSDPDGTSDYVGGDGWSMTENRAAVQWFNGQRFFTMVNGVATEVTPLRNRSDGYYLRTHKDDILANNLGVLCRKEWRGWGLPTTTGLGGPQRRGMIGR